MKWVAERILCIKYCLTNKNQHYKKKEINEKKYELLSDEELLEVCGGDSVGVDVMAEVKNLLCKRATSKEECKQYDFCSWHHGSFGAAECQYEG